jgi:hypothetical protein
MPCYSSISEASIGGTGTLVGIYTNLYTFILFVKTQEDLDAKVSFIEEFYGHITKIEWFEECL